jgi:hypothetical protein
MSMDSQPKLPDLILGAFREAMDLGDHKVAECLFMALEAHSDDPDWRRALDNASRTIIGCSSVTRPQRRDH